MRLGLLPTISSGWAVIGSWSGSAGEAVLLAPREAANVPKGVGLLWRVPLIACFRLTRRLWGRPTRGVGSTKQGVGSYARARIIATDIVE